VVRIQHAVLAERPPEAVFAFLTEPANFPKWQSGVLEIASAGKLGLGDTFTEVRTFLGQRAESTLEVTEYLPNERFSLRVVSGPWLFDVFHRLVPIATGTRVEVTFEGETKGRLRLAGPMLERAVRGDLERNLSALKDALETAS
jgi:carbon monoxide dehydrogenase subunit G